jgi:uncharacterized protein
MMRHAEHQKATNNATCLNRRSLAAIALALLTSAGTADADDAAVCVGAFAKEQWTRALPACTKAANQGDAGAQYFLGFMYNNGHGVVQDYVQAAKWHMQAAERGNMHSQVLLGRLYREGHGVAQDYVRAHMWFNLAAASGHGVARNNRDTVASKMTREQIARAQKMATDCKAKNYKNCN